MKAPFPTMTPQAMARFWSHVTVGDADACWPWTAARNEKGYGVTGIPGRRTSKAHRVAYAVHHGDPGNLCVLHRCDNPPCCNPAHLFLGTRADNNRDMIGKGRGRMGQHTAPVLECGYRRGERHHYARLTADIVMAIRSDRSAGLSYSTIAKRHHIATSHAFKVATGRLWNHV